jgi:hypothetical protein
MRRRKEMDGQSSPNSEDKGGHVSFATRSIHPLATFFWSSSHRPHSPPSIHHCSLLPVHRIRDAVFLPILANKGLLGGLHPIINKHLWGKGGTISTYEALPCIKRVHLFPQHFLPWP